VYIIFQVVNFYMVFLGIFKYMVNIICYSVEGVERNDHMNYFSEISRIIDYGLEGNKDKLSFQIKMLVKQLEKNGEQDEAHALKIKLKNKIKSGNIYTQNALHEKPIPVEKDNRFPLADYETFSENDIWLSLPENIDTVIKKFLAYINYKDKLESEGIPVNPTMIIHGYPGTGKSKLAAYIAAKLSLPLITARSDALVSSYLGSTSKNIRMLMEYARERECVLFLDEFDALAKGRDESNEVGELKRVVISLLQNIDALDNVILIAATNHPHLLDRAVWRRFQYKIEVPLPNRESRKDIAAKLLQDYISSKVLNLFSDISEGISGAEIENIIFEYKRECILNDYRKNEKENRLLQLLISYLYPDITFIKRNRKYDIVKIKEKFNDLSAEKIGLIFGLTKQRIATVLREEKVNAK